MTTMAKGSIARSGHAHIRQTFGEDVWVRALASLTDEERSHVTNASRATSYPIAVDGKIFTFICEELFGGDCAQMERSMRAMGARQADEMLDGVFSVFARFVSPTQAFSRAGSIIASAYTGVTHATKLRADGRGGTLRMTGFSELPHGAASIAGWIERALTHFGAKDARVVERNYAAGRIAADELVFDLSWD